MSRLGSAAKHLLLAMIPLLLAACALGSGPGEATSPAATVPGGTGSTSTMSGSASSSSADGSETGTDESTGEHPDGVFQSTPVGRPCTQVRAGDSAPASLALKRLGTLTVCFAGFPDPASPVSVSLVGPQGFRHRDLAQGGKVSWSWTIVARLAVPLGSYTFQATQAASSVTIEGSLEVATATHPAVFQVGGIAPSGAPGLLVELAGFGRGAVIDAFLYGPASGARLPFARPLPRVHLDDRGEGRYAVEALATDPPGSYGVWFGPAPGACPGPCATFHTS